MINMADIQISENSRKLLLFFTLTFTISWTIWFLAPLISLGDILLLNWICLIGAFGPSISATILASRIESNREDYQKKKKWNTFCIILIVSFLSALSSFPLFYLNYINIEFFFCVIIVVIVASIIASLLISGIYSSNPGIFKLLQPIKGVKGRNIYLFIAFLIPLLLSLGGLIFVILGGTISIDVNYFIPLLSMTLLFPHMFFFGGPLNEEIGWRGFATPHLLEKYNPLITGLIIGIIWSIWHAPLHFIGFDSGGWLGLLWRFTYNIPLGIIFTWYYVKSQGNLLGAIVLHASVNVYFNVFFGAYIYIILIYIVFAFVIIAYGKMWKKLPNIKK